MSKVFRIALCGASRATDSAFFGLQALNGKDYHSLQPQALLAGISRIYRLARARVSRDDLAISGGHNAGNTRATTQKETCRRYYYKH